MDENLIRYIWARAGNCCEYCRLPQVFSTVPFEIDHIIARKHGGKTTRANLALACFFCNSYKGANLAGLDPQTGALTPLFHPRRHKWHAHFRWEGGCLIGRTPIGRTTIAVLVINAPEAVATRAALIDAGLFPPR
jgi:hypothetical protein